MNDSTLITAAWAALATAVAAALAEWLHHRRVRRLGRLAFGPGGVRAPGQCALPA